jgi:hypothetical protein
MFAIGRELVAPGELATIDAAARGEFPLGFGWQLLARPFGVSERIGIGDMQDRMVV